MFPRNVSDLRWRDGQDDAVECYWSAEGCSSGAHGHGWAGRHIIHGGAQHGTHMTTQ